MKTSHKDKIVVVGAGNVGEAIAYTLMIRKQASDIVLIDLNEARAKGDALDISHGTSFYNQVTIRQGGYEECADADIIIVTAGVARKPGQTRLDLAKVNVSIMRSVTESIMQYAKNPIIVVVSNPADIITAEIQAISGLPANRVIGSGTSLDTARLRYNLSEALNVSVKDVQAYVLGEHGDSQVPIYSSAAIGGVSLDSAAEQLNVTLDKEDIAKRTREGGAEVIGLKGATFYGVATCLMRITRAILRDEDAVLPVSAYMEGQYGLNDIYIGTPAVVNGSGLDSILEVPLNEEEHAKMTASAKTLKEVLTNGLKTLEEGK